MVGDVVEEANTGGGSYIEGTVNTNGGGFVGRDHLGNATTTVNVSDSLSGYTMADLRLDLRFLKQEVDRLREDENASKSENREANNRLAEMKREIEFMEAQVNNILLLKPVPKDAASPAQWQLSMLTIIACFLALIVVLVLIYIASGR